MGKELLRNFPCVKSIFERVDTCLNYSISNIMLNGSEDELRETKNCQPALFVFAAAVLEVIRHESHYPNFSIPKYFSFAAGHSAGELISMYATNVLSLEDCASILRMRGSLIQTACEKCSGGVSVVMFCSKEIIEQAIFDAIHDPSNDPNTQTFCEITNINSPTQFAISGDNQSLQKVGSILKRYNRKSKMVNLNVSCPFHSSVLSSVSKEMDEYVKKFAFCSPSIPIISNVTAQPLYSPISIQNLVGKQISSPVLWDPSVKWLIKEGNCVEFVEIGPKPQLIPLIDVISQKKVKSHAVCNIDGIKSFMSHVSTVDL